MDCRKKCFKLPQEVVDNLNVVHNNESSVLVFWNKYQIFIMDKTKLDTQGHLSNWRPVCNTEFEIHRLLLAKHLICLDKKGRLLAYTLTQTATQQKRPRQDFQNLARNILCIESYEDFLISLKLEMEELYIRIDKLISNDNINLNMKKYSANKIENKNLLILPSEIKREQCILCCHRVDQSDFDNNNLILKGKIRSQYPQFIIIMSFNKLTLYAVLVDLELNENVLTPVKLLTCPQEISSVTVIKEDCLHVIISLSSGTVIKQPLNNNTPNIAHLNTAIHKSLVLKDKIIYSDCSTMWVSTSTFSESDCKLKQLFIKNVRDFIIIDDNKIICTTYSKLVYIFNMKDESSYLIPVTTIEYYPAEHLLNNMHYMHNIMEEVEKNNDIINNIKKEENHITTLALSNRQDIMQEVIKCKVNVYEYYEDILKENLVLNLTNRIEDYFAKDTFCFLIQMYLAKQQNFDDVLENMFTDAKIHVTILSAQKIVKTFCVKVLDQLKSFNIVIPLRMETLNVTDLCLNIKIVKKIPKVFNSKHNLWTALYCKDITVTPEHFIKLNHSSKNVHALKDPSESIQTLLYETANKYHGHLYRITKSSEDLLTWSFYIKLPIAYKEFLNNETFYNDNFESVKAKYLLKEISSDGFLNARKSISFSVVNEKFEVQIINDGFSSPSGNMMRVSSVNPILALEIRNFLSNLAHNNFQQYKPRQEFLNNSKIISSLEVF